MSILRRVLRTNQAIRPHQPISSIHHRIPRTVHTSTIRTMSSTNMTDPSPAMSAFIHEPKEYTEDLSKKLPEPSGNVVDIITDEHQLVESLFKDYKATSDKKSKQGIANNIIKLLSQHAACEEMTIYPWLKSKGDQMKHVVDHGIHEHQKMKEDLYELDKMHAEEDPGFEARFDKTVHDTIHHHRSEEKDILSELTKYASPAEMKQMTEQFIKTKKISPSRPHPGGPNNSIFNKAANAAATGVDAVRDVGRFEK